MSVVDPSQVAAEPQAEPAPARNYKALHVVADDLERDEHVTFGVIWNGAFVPIAQHAKGLLEPMVARWSDLGGTSVEAHAERDVQQLQDRVAKLERAALASGWQLDEQQPPSETQQTG